jgi:4,5-dihydroxyphthalate decarboxylase
MPRELLTLTRRQGANAALVDQIVSPRGYALRLADEPVLVAGFRAMVRELRYDVAELALTTYLTAREHGARFTALPVFLVRGFHHAAILVRADSGIQTATQLTGQRVAVSRGYTVTTGVWARVVLSDRGLDLGTVTWVRTSDEHVREFVPPPNVVDAPAGSDVLGLLRSGDVAAAVGVTSTDPDLRPLIPDAERAGLEELRSGHYPINHLLVVRDELLEAEPTLGRSVFEAFARAKRSYLDRLDEDGSPQGHLLRSVREVTGEDPLPYGLAPNRTVLEELLMHARDQRILTGRPRLESLFDPATLDLTG